MVGQAYSRSAISQQIGGNPQAVLPTKAGRVVARCYRPEKNAHAPDKLFFGDIYTRSAEVLAKQGRVIPLFGWNGNAKCKYLGDYSVKHWTDDPVVVAAEAEGLHDDRVKIVLFMERH